MKSDKNDIEIRFGEASDRDTLYELWQACFHDSDAFTDYYFEDYFRENRVLMLEDDGQLKAMLHLNAYDVMLAGQLANSAYIVGVATAEDYRHRGAMTRLLEQTFAIAYSEKMPFVYLMPADEAIYRPFEFAWMYAQRVEEPILMPNTVARFEQRAGTGGIPSHLVRLNADQNAASEQSIVDISVLPAHSTADWEAAAAMANDYMAKNYGIYTRRDAWYFERLQRENRVDGGDLLMLYGDGNLIGYLSYAKEGAAEVREVYCFPEWRQQAARWLIGFFADVKTKVLPLSVDGLLTEPGQANCGTRPIIMGRIICLDEWMGGMPVSGRPFSLCMNVKDSWISANAGTWLWQSVGPGHGVLFERTERTPDIEIGIDGLLQWLAGYETIDYMEAEGQLRILTDCLGTLNEIPVLKRILMNEII